MSTLETPVSRRLSSVKNVIVVISGKGGVGKSSSTVQLALSLLATSPTVRVGLLDIDLTGPSLPRMLGLDSRAVHQSSSGWVPVYADQERRLGCMSIGFLLQDRGDSVVWRGPKKDGMIRQFLAEVRWGDLDYLVIDTPPGTSDEHISLLTHLHPLFLPSPSRPPSHFSPTPTSILISTPQATALNDTLKSLSFTRKLNLPVLGFVENMSGYACPCCGEISEVFSKGGGEKMAREEKVGYLGRVPIDTKLVELLDEVVKGNIPVGDDVETRVGQVSIGNESENQVKESDKPGLPSDVVSVSDPALDKPSQQSPFPLLDRYQETTSSKIWKTITDDILARLEERKALARAELEGDDNTSNASSDEDEQ